MAGRVAEEVVVKGGSDREIIGVLLLCLVNRGTSVLCVALGAHQAVTRGSLFRLRSSDLLLVLLPIRCDVPSTAFLGSRQSSRRIDTNQCGNDQLYASVGVLRSVAVRSKGW